MDPRYDSTPTSAGIEALPTGACLEYEIRAAHGVSKPVSTGVLVLMGAFSTYKHFIGTADKVAAAGFDILLFNHRGVGRSYEDRCVDNQPQSTQLLAKDALALVDTIWGPQCKLHIVGVSMGAMVLQKLAILLLTSQRTDRVASLSIVHSAMSLQNTWTGWLGSLATPSIFNAFSGFFLSPSIDQIVRVALKPEFRNRTLNSLPPPSPQHLLATHSAVLDSETVGEAWRIRWEAEADQWFTYGNSKTTAAHAAIVIQHSLSEPEQAILRDKCAQCMAVWVAGKDDVIPPQKQHELVNVLKPSFVVIDPNSGHVVATPGELEKFNQELVTFLISQSSQ